jgi:hypothetical protein
MPNSRYGGYQYETSPRKLKPEYKPNKKEDVKKKSTTINKNKVNKKNKKKKHLKPQTKIVTYVVLGFVILLAISYRNSLITERFSKKEQLKSDLAVIEKENQQLEVNIQNSLNLSNIEKAAKENSGMKKLDSTQKRYVNLPKKDYVEPASEQVIIEEEKNWFEKVVELLTEKIFRKLLYFEYIVIFLRLSPI